jgi:hypothetical protein
MIDVMAKLKDIAESGYDNEDIQRGIDAAATQVFAEEEAVAEEELSEKRGSKKRSMQKNDVANDKEPVEEEEEVVEEGYYEMPPMDRERYTDIPGLEGPFTTRSGKVVYYDPKEGKYYDRDSDMYLSYEEFKDYDQSRPEDFKITKMELPKSMEKESVEEVHEDVEEDTSLDDMLKLAGRSGVMGLSQNNIIAESLELDEEDEVEVREDTQENEVKRVIAKILGRYRPLTYDDFDNEDLNSALYDFFSNSGEIPYDVVTSGDPNEWIFDKLNSLGMTEDLQEEAVEETVAVPVQALEELMRLAGYENYEAKINEYENDPEVEYMDVEDQMIGLSGGLNGPKKAYAAAAGGDNAMAQEPTEVDESLEESFYSEYSKMVEDLRSEDD